LLAILGLLLFTGSPAGTEPNAKNILVLYSVANRRVFGNFDQLKSELRAHVPWPVDLHVEYFDNQEFYDGDDQRSLIEALKRAGGGKKLDLAIVDGYPALQFSIKHRDEIFPGVPIVFYDVDAGSLAGRRMQPAVTGVIAPVDVRGTIDLALRLNPEANAIAVVSGGSAAENYWFSVIHAELLRDQNKVREIDLVALPTSHVMTRVAALPPQTVLLVNLAIRESVEDGWGNADFVGWLGQRRPTYCIFPVDCLDHGGIGGVGYDGDQQISLAADLAKRVLSGERPESIPPRTGSGHQVRVDWRQLRRWNIAVSALPPGSVVLNEPPSFWQQYGRYVLAIIFMLLAQTLVILAVLWQRASRIRIRTEAELRESQERFRLVADTAPLMIWMSGPDKLCTFFNRGWLGYTGRPLAAELGNGWAEGVHPEDLRKCLDAYINAFDRREPFRMEYRLRRHDGEYRWIFDQGVPRFDARGVFAGYIGSGIDVTERKLAEEAISTVSQKLTEAQEQERSRLARELHDDINQRLALLAITLESLKHGLPASAADLAQKIGEASQQIADVGEDIQALSHSLHSPKLELLGFVRAAASFCNEFSELNKVEVDFGSQDVARELPLEISLCLFRVLQEALQNATKHSGSNRFQVLIRGGEDEVELTVQDSGIGFEPEEAIKGRGLGLTSMRERLKAVDGQLLIDSQPQKGTTLCARVPVSSRTKSAREVA
jgi:PAS domain S-box-containing protein